MIHRKKTILTSLVLLIIVQFLIYFNNTEKSSLKIFIWNSQEIRLGELISASFLSGFFVSLVINNFIISKNDNNSKNREFENPDENESFKDIKNDRYISEIPPERDIRDPQPTISVKYRVIKDSKNNISDYDSNSIDNSSLHDDWSNEESDW